MPQKVANKAGKKVAIVSHIRLANEKNGRIVTRFIYHINFIMTIHEINDNDMQELNVLLSGTWLNND